MTPTNYQEGMFNGRSNPDRRPRPRPVVHVPSKAASRDDIDAALAGIVEKHKAMYSHHKTNQR